MNAPHLVQKLWNYCNILRDDGLSYGGYAILLSGIAYWVHSRDKWRAEEGEWDVLQSGTGFPN